MNKKFHTLRLIFFTSLVLAVLAGLYLDSVNNTLNQSEQCIFFDNTCSFDSQHLDLHISFLDAPIIEEELFISFEISQGNQIKSAWIEGINMYMGKTPIIFEDEKSKDKLKGVTFLGSCSEPKMQWQLLVEVKDKAGQTKVYSALFKTRSQ